MSRRKRQRLADDTCSLEPVSFFSDNVIQMPSSRQNFKRLTANHHRVVNAIKSSPITLINGPAGSLKTFLSLQTGISFIENGVYDKILYIRQRIKRPNEPELGSLPGSQTEKLYKQLAPILDNLEAILTPYELDNFVTTKIECSDIESLRGRSPLRTFIFCDEAQNCDLTALETVLTRRTECSRLVLAGDFKGQRDIMDADFDAYELVCGEFAGTFPVINLSKDDILRSETNKQIIEGFERIKARLKS